MKFDTRVNQAAADIINAVVEDLQSGVECKVSAPERIRGILRDFAYKTIEQERVCYLTVADAIGPKALTINTLRKSREAPGLREICSSEGQRSWKRLFSRLKAYPRQAASTKTSLMWLKALQSESRRRMKKRSLI
jgi:hypothetical protein